MCACVHVLTSCVCTHVQVHTPVASPPPLLPLPHPCCLSPTPVASPPPLLPLPHPCCLSPTPVASPPPLLPLPHPCCLSLTPVASPPPLLPLPHPCCLSLTPVASPPPLLPLPQTFSSSQLKVGVLNVKKGQTCEAEIFGNLHESGHFRKFLEMLGE